MAPDVDQRELSLHSHVRLRVLVAAATPGVQQLRLFSSYYAWCAATALVCSNYARCAATTLGVQRLRLVCSSYGWGAADTASVQQARSAAILI